MNEVSNLFEKEYEASAQRSRCHLLRIHPLRPRVAAPSVRGSFYNYTSPVPPLHRQGRHLSSQNIAGFPIQC